MTDTTNTPPTTIQQLVAAAMPAAIQAAIAANPASFVEAGLLAEVRVLEAKGNVLLHNPKAVAFAAVVIAAVFTGIGLLIAHFV